MITAGKVSETLVLDGIKWGMGILLVLLYGSVHSQLEQYNPIIIYTSLILYILLFLADFIPSYRHKEKTDIQFKLFLYIGSLCLFFILVFLIKVPQYTASHTPFIISSNKIPGYRSPDNVWNRHEPVTMRRNNGPLSWSIRLPVLSGYHRQAIPYR